MYWLLISAIWGTWRLAQTSWYFRVDEKEWGFGQILPVFLLIGPIVAAIEAIAPESEPEERTSALDRHESTEDTGGHVVSSNGITSPHPPTSQPAVTPTTRPEAQALLFQQPAASTPSTPQKLTPSQLRVQLHAYYTDKHAMATILALAGLQVLLMTVMLVPIITISSFKVTSILATSAINLLLVQPTNCFMAMLWGVVWRVDDGVALTELLVVYDRGSQGWRRRSRWRRWCGALLRGVSVLSLAGIGMVLLSFGHGTFKLENGGSALLVLYLGGGLLFLCGVAVWDVLVRPWVAARRRRHDRTDALPLVDRADGNLSV